jgi:Enoyl-CoA hydratase/carnithine racemase
MIYKHIELEYQPGFVTLWLNRSEKRNAFDLEMIEEMDHAVKVVNGLDDNVVMVLKGRGEAFCAGGDLGWMQRSIDLSQEANYKECLQLSGFLYNLYTCNKVTIAVVHGAAYGGGVGLAAACDMAICSDDTQFSLSELRMGLVASSISPYVLKKIGENRTKELVFTSRLFTGQEAEKFGLVNRSVSASQLDAVLNEYLSQIAKGAPKARALAKKLILELSPLDIDEAVVERTASLLAEVRVADEAQNRINSFLKKITT